MRLWHVLQQLIDISLETITIIIDKKKCGHIETILMSK